MIGKRLTDYQKGLAKLGFTTYLSLNRDLRREATFAWRVQEAYCKLVSTELEYFTWHNGAKWQTKFCHKIKVDGHGALADALYAAVEALGKEDGE